MTLPSFTVLLSGETLPGCGPAIATDPLRHSTGGVKGGRWIDENRVGIISRMTTAHRPAVFWPWAIGTALVLAFLLSAVLYQAWLDQFHPPRPSEVKRKTPAVAGGCFCPGGSGPRVFRASSLLGSSGFIVCPETALFGLASTREV